jgi:uncharacterized membrane protein YdcZ (DUF606 family)
MKDRKFIYAIIYFLIGLFCLVWGSIVYMSYPHLIEIMKNAFKAAWIQYVVGFACFMISLYLSKDKK